MFKKFTVMTAATALLALAAVTNVNADELYGTLKKIKDTGVVNLGHREASVPFAYIGADGKPI
jgi:glutamate/aspartate transport system substrate-binding protein